MQQLLNISQHLYFTALKVRIMLPSGKKRHMV